MFVEALPEQTQRNLALLADAGLAEPYHLAGGTAAALHLGHRLSIDLDFFGGLDVNLVHVVKALAYFADAEPDPMPRMLVKAAWNEVKRFFENEARSLLKMVE